MSLYTYLQAEFLGNTIENYCWFIGIILVGLLLKKYLAKFLSLLVYRLLKKQVSDVGFDHFLELVKKPFGTFVTLTSFYIAFQYIDFPKAWHFASVEKFGARMVIHRLFLVVIIVSITQIVLRIVDFFGLVLIHKAQKSEPPSDHTLIPFLKESIKVVLIILSVFFVLGTVFHLNVSSLIAGLGIGGLAIALAAKETLENLLGSFTIFFDKPFVLGNIVKVDGVEGTVEKIGFRSTRIRTPDNSVVTLSNKKMVENKLENLSLRIKRRANFSIVLKPTLTSNVVKKIVTEMNKLINTNDNLTNDGAINLSDIGTSGYVIKVDYFVNEMDFKLYQNVREEINLKIIDIILKNNAEFLSKDELSKN